MRGRGVTAAPSVNTALVRAFGRYVHWYLRRNFHSVRVANEGGLERYAGKPLVVCLNHPSWWDPLIALELAMQIFPGRKHYAPIDTAALNKYKFFEKLGFFGVEPHGPRGAAAFLRTGQAILAQPDAALWVTVQGEFADPRVRPVQLRPGVGGLLRRCGDVVVLPLAIELPFWEERYPEALARFGDPAYVSASNQRPAEAQTAAIADALQRTQDQLARDAVARNRDAFRVLVGGRAGVGGMYDSWRALNAWIRGRSFDAAHGHERL